MKYSLVNGEKQAPEPKISGLCPFCGAKVISKCGNKNVWHWAHYSKRNCDQWWENETDWHRSWKDQFPVGWQEVIHKADNGEKHIADVKTADGCIIEFQHSFISINERESRDNFYPNLVWIVDGKRRKRDEKQFFEALKAGTQVLASPLLIKFYIDESRIVDEWKDSKANVFFDFGEIERVWWLLPFRDGEWGYVIPFSKSNFIELHKGKRFEKYIDFIDKILKDLEFLLKQKNKHRSIGAVPIPLYRKVRRPYYRKSLKRL